MPKEETKNNNCGLTAVILGILSILFAGINGLILAILALTFASKQNPQNIWSRRGKTLGIIGLVCSIIAIIILIWLYKNPGILNQYIPTQ
ncbi:hypothetical protein J4402_04595 [Candidatus Pacearchaeota archaeon]|nr:hypothetical protein [Candidatus Pacearchaeota archaeon]